MGSSEDDNPSQHEGEEERKAVRKGYRKLMDKLAGEEEDLVNIDNQHLIGYMQENEELFGKVCAPQEAVLDAKVVRHISRICRQQAEGMSSNITQFQFHEYAEKLVQGMRGRMSDDGGGALTKKKWVMLGQQAKSLFRKSPSFSYMFGALDNAPPPPKERKARVGRQATRLKDLVETQETVLEQAEKSDNQTEQLVTHTLKTLIEKWKENQKKPVGFFEFVMDPDSFGNTVENMFHVSFLIKDGRAEVSREDGQLPTIRPKKKKDTEGASKGDEANNQVVMNISMREWRFMVTNLGITTAAIPHIRPKEEVKENGFKKPRTQN